MNRPWLVHVLSALIAIVAAFVAAIVVRECGARENTMTTYPSDATITIIATFETPEILTRPPTRTPVPRETPRASRTDATDEIPHRTPFETRSTHGATGTIDDEDRRVLRSTLRRETR